MTLALPILIVEDERPSVAELCVLLQSKGILYEIVPDRLAAEEKLKENKYSLLLLDVHLVKEEETDPFQSGVLLLQRLRSGGCGDNNSGIPVVVLTAHPELEIEDQVKQGLGASQFISKPAKDEDVCNVIMKLVGLSTGDSPKGDE